MTQHKKLKCNKNPNLFSDDWCGQKHSLSGLDVSQQVWTFESTLAPPAGGAFTCEKVGCEQVMIHVEAPHLQTVDR